jgi:hypothetical protein
MLPLICKWVTHRDLVGDSELSIGRHWVTSQRGRMELGKAPSWEVSDGFWAKVEPLIPRAQRDPRRAYRSKAGGGGSR